MRSEGGSPWLPWLQSHWEGAEQHPLALPSLWGVQHLLPQAQGHQHPQRDPQGFPAGEGAGAGQAPPAQQSPALPFPPQKTPLVTHVPKPRGQQTPPLQSFLPPEQKAALGQHWGIWGHGVMLLQKVLASLRPPRLQETTAGHLQHHPPAHLVPPEPGGHSRSGCWGQSGGLHWVPALRSARVQGGAEKQAVRWLCHRRHHQHLEPPGAGAASPGGRQGQTGLTLLMWSV